MRLLQLPGLHRRHVLRPRAVAAFAGDSWNQLIELEMAVAHGPGGMTPETSPNFLRLQHAAEGILQR